MRTTAPGQSALLLLDVISIFNEKHIPYAIIGAFAASYYGVVRASLDADALISLSTPHTAQDLCSLLREKGFLVEYRIGESDDPVKGVISFEDVYHNRVDLLTGIRGMSPEAFLRVNQVQFMDVDINIIGLEDFIAMKVFAGSPKDIQDVIGVLNVSGNAINRNLLLQLTGRFDPQNLKTLNDLLRIAE